MGKRLATAVQETWVKTLSKPGEPKCDATLEIIPTRSGTKLISTGRDNGKRHYRDVFTESEAQLNARRAALIQDGYMLTVKQIKVR
jgi:hypothetical protein